MMTVSDSGVGLTPELLYPKRNRGAVTGQAAATSASQVRERILVLRQRGHRGGATPFLLYGYVWGGGFGYVCLGPHPVSL